MLTLLGVLGLVVIAVVLWDLLITVFSASGAGFLTRAWTQPVWAVMLRVHRRHRIHRTLSLTGPAMVFLAIVIWYGLLALGAFLVFASSPDAVVRSTDRSPVQGAEGVYFVGSTLSGLGYGDLVPVGFPWTLAASLGALLATVVLTTSLSYILSVLVPAVQRKAFASGVRALGGSPAQIVQTAALHDSHASLKPYVTGLCTQMSDIASKHLAYPVLRHFHSTRLESSPARAVLLLSDACFLMERQPTHTAPPPGLIRLLRASTQDYCGIETTGATRSPDAASQREYLQEQARVLSITVDSAYADAQETYLARRQGLVELCDADGWPVQATAGG